MVNVSRNMEGGALNMCLAADPQCALVCMPAQLPSCGAQ